MPYRLTLLAHAPTQAQRAAAFPLDEAVEAAGLRHAASVAQTLALTAWRRVDRLWAAPERRTRQTAAALAAAGLAVDIGEVLELRDLDHGRWGGRSLADVGGADPAGVAAWLDDPAAAPHGGESLLALLRRVGAWLAAFTEPGHTLIVTHPAVIRAALTHVLAADARAFWRLDIAPLSITDLRHNGRWTVRALGQPLELMQAGEVTLSGKEDA